MNKRIWMNSFDYKEYLKKIPDNPGVYRFYNIEKEILYVGKAKNLKSRVSSYFNKSSQHNYKTIKLVSQINDIEFTIVNNEYDALLLENNLIKNFQPRYNILLKDDKSYPFICVSNEKYPRVFPTRRPELNEGKLYGPYASVRAMNNVLDLFPKLYNIRSCTLNLNEKNISAGKFKVCLEYHLGNCKGPCEGLQNEESYNKEIDLVHQILKGNLAPARQYFTEQMNLTSSNLEFEKAHKFKIRLETLDSYQSKSLIVNPKMNEVDVFTIISDEKAAYINFIKVSQGLIIQSKNVEVKKKMDESDGEILTLMVVEMRNEFKSQANEVITNEALTTNILGVDCQIPQIGDKRKLIELSYKNVLYFKKEITEANLSQQEKKEQRDKRVLETLQKDLRLKSLPIHIECFDNSNMQGTNPVASMVCFKNGFSAKKEYRHFNIKTVIGPNDFDSMKEIVGRRYKRLIIENSSLPDLIIVDGGKGQLSSAVEALEELNIYGQVPIIGIAKRLEEIYFPGDTLPIYINKKSESLKLIQRIRDEAHRFAITFHRDQRSKNSLQGQLDFIDGIGEKTSQKLLSTYKSVKKIKEVSFEELSNLIGKDKATIVIENLK